MSAPLDKYVRFTELTGAKKNKEGVKLGSFDFAPAKASLELGRSSKKPEQVDHLPPLEELIDEKDAAYVSGQENFKKMFDCRVVSRLHASIRWQPNQLYPTIVDEGSMHGTYIMHMDGSMRLSDVSSMDSDDLKWVKVQRNKPTTLRDGDVIQLGKKVNIDDKISVPLRLLVEIFISEQHNTKDKFTVAELISDEEDDDDVVETTDPKLQRGTVTKSAEAKKQLTVILSDDEESDEEEYGNDITIGYEEIRTVIESEDDEDCNLLARGSDAEPTSGDEESDAASVIDSGAGGAVESDESEQSEDEQAGMCSSEDQSDEEENEDDDEGEEEEEEGQILETAPTELVLMEQSEKICANNAADQMDDDIDEYDYDDVLLDNVDFLDDLDDEMDQVVAAAVEAAHLESTNDLYLDQVVLEDHADMAVMEPIPSEAGPEGEDEEGEEAADASSSSGSSIANSSETKITSSDADGTDDITVEMLQEKIATDEVMINALAEEPVVLEAASTQLTVGKKRSHDDIDEAEDQNDETTKTTVLIADTTTVKFTPVSLPPHKKLKTFGAGLAAGLVAGMVGTFVGLSSLALNDSSLV